MRKSKTAVTTTQLSSLLPAFLRKVGGLYEQTPTLIVSAWPTVVGPALAPYTRAISFIDGVLLVAVKNSTLYSLLNQNDKPKIVQNLRSKFPHIMIKTVFFRLE